MAGEDRWLLIGLGNPGPKYVRTRHNYGFLVIDQLARDLAVTEWREKSKGLYAEARIGESPVLLLKPQTFMNASGDSACQFAAFYKIPASRVLVAVDDYALPFGTRRLRGEGGDGGHNGLKSLAGFFGTKYARLRLGIRSRQVEIHERTPQTDFVLQNFSEEEAVELPALVKDSAQAMRHVVDSGLAAAMNRWNRSPAP